MGDPDRVLFSLPWNKILPEEGAKLDTNRGKPFCLASSRFSPALFADLQMSFLNDVLANAKERVKNNSRRLQLAVKRGRCF